MYHKKSKMQSLYSYKLSIDQKQMLELVGLCYMSQL